MAHEVFTGDWARNWCEELQRSAAYRSAAQNWEGALVLKMRTAPGDRAVYLDLWRGDCRAARAAREEDAERAPFVISADASSWRQILAGELEPVAAIAMGRLNLEKGNMLQLATQAPAARELVNAARRVGGSFPEGLA